MKALEKIFYCKTAEAGGPEMLNCADKLAPYSLVIFALMAMVMCYWGNVALRNIIPFFTKTIITFPMLQLLQQGVWERGQCLNVLRLLHYHNFSSGDFCTVKVGSYWAEKEQFRHCAIFHTISLYFLGKAINVLFLPS